MAISFAIALTPLFDRCCRITNSQVCCAVSSVADKVEPEVSIVVENKGLSLSPQFALSVMQL